MNQIILMDAFEMIKLAKSGIREVEEQLQLCSQELDQPITEEEASEIIGQMMELTLHQTACKTALKTINEYVKKIDIFLTKNLAPQRLNRIFNQIK